MNRGALMSEVILKSVKLGNGLTLDVKDMSRRISADAYAVKLQFVIDIMVTQERCEKADLPFREVKRLFDKKGCLFLVEIERNFIKEEVAEEVKEELIRSYLATNQNYMAHPGFADGVLKRTFYEKKKRFV